MNCGKRFGGLGRRLVSLAVAAGLAVSSGCATLAHRNATPEEAKTCGRPGEACPWLVGDALLLIPFLIPGVIAFVVDFSNGEWKHGEYHGEGEVRTASATEGDTGGTGQ